MIKVIAKADRILSEISCGNGMNFSALQNVTGMNKSTLSQIMRTLAELGWVRKDNAGYFVPGGKLENFAKEAVGRESLRGALSAAVSRLADVSGELASASILAGTGRVRIAVKEGRGELIVDDNKAESSKGIMGTATGKLLFAFQDRATRLRIMKAEGMKDSPSLKVEVERIRKTGTAGLTSSSGLVKSVARGIFDPEGKIAASIGVALPASFCPPEREREYEDMVEDAADFAGELLKS